MAMVHAKGLEKRFGATVALRGVDLQVEEGSVLGVLGPNGAGKTTTVRILTTLLRPDAGRAVIDGVDVALDPRGARRRIGLTGQYAAVDERLTARENLEHVGRLFHLPRRVARERADGLLLRFDLEEAADRAVQGYSGGMRRRLDIAMSLIGEPKVLFLDEPTTGLDPRSRLAVWELTDDLARTGTTILLTTQYLEEADRLADRVVVIDHGTVIAEGTAAELKRRVGGDRVEVEVETSADLTTAAEHLARWGTGPVALDESARRVVVPVAELDGLVPQVVRELDALGVAVRDIGVRRATLDDVFFAVTGHATGPDGETGRARAAEGAR